MIGVTPEGNFIRYKSFERGNAATRRQADCL